MKQKYELLAPVGDFAMLRAAIDVGADSVYFGLQEFSMRTGSKNFRLRDLSKIKKICDEKKVKKYLTLNTIVYDSELKRLEKVVKSVKGFVDAVICWDLSVIKLCKKYKIPFHVSTQASVSNIEAVKFYEKMGAKAIVLARELGLRQIKKIVKEAKVPIETFAHGAMCVSVSGRCFMSQFLFQKSANRGECIHPCRRKYTVTDSEGNQLGVEESTVLSAKDLCTLPFIEDMKKIGIKIFKLEGRNRDPRYVDVVVRTYRKALDSKLSKKQTEELVEELRTVYNRDFSAGFYLKLPSGEDFATIEHSAGTEYKHFAGKVKHYFDKLGVCVVELVSKLKVGDKIVVIGQTTGAKKFVIGSLEQKRKSVFLAEKGEDVGIKIPFRVRKNDEVYIIKKRRKRI